MSKIDKVIYGIEDEELLNKIIQTLSYTEASWDNINPTAFDDTDMDAYKLDGHLYKNFYRCFSNAIPKLFDSTLYKQPSYKTYFSNISQNGLIPEKISVLLKAAHRKSTLVQEVIASQILNFFNCKTPFNFAVKTQNDNDNYLASIDFISYNEKLVLFNELNIIWTEDVNAMVKQLDCLTKDKTSVLYNTKTENLTKLKDDLILSFLVRYCLLKDADFDLYNCGLLVNKLNNSVSFINFDFELCLKPTYFSEAKNILIKFIMSYACENNSSLYYNFIDICYILNQVLTEVNFENNDKYYNQTISVLKDNLQQVIDIHNSLNIEFVNNPLSLN